MLVVAGTGGAHWLLLVATMGLATRSAAADPSKAECITASEDGQLARHEGKLRLAREKLTICIAESCPRPVREDCSQLLSEVNQVIPTLILQVEDSTGNDVSARITMDGEPFVERLDGTAVPVDPGEHRFMFEAKGLPSTVRTFVLREGQRGRRERVAFGPRVREVAPAVPAATAGETAESGGVGGTQRIIGLVLGGAGIASVLVGSVFGIVAKVTWDGAHPECQPNCSAPSVQDSHTAGSQADVSTVAFALGGVLLAGGAVVYFTAPTAAKPVGVVLAPTGGAGGAGLDIRGLW